MIRSLSNGQRAALIVNECQNGVIDPKYSHFGGLAQQVEARGIRPKIARLADAFRAQGLPVFHLPVQHRADFKDVKANSLIMALSLKNRSMTEGSVEAEYVPDLLPQPGDIEVVRTSGLIGFLGTSLDALLRRMDIETVVLTGVSTNVAMPGNTMAAVELGYHVVIPEDCIAGSDPETHAVIVREQLRMVATITTSDEVMAAIGAAEAA